MTKRARTRVQSLALALILLAPPYLAAAPGAAPPPAPGPLYARDPDVGASAILFVSGDDLWTVPREGGVARRVATGAGPKRRPKLSPDGATIAFTGRHDGLYTVPAAGGEPSRVTHHPGATDLCDWTADGRLLFMTDGFMHLFDGDSEARIRQLFTVAAEGGLPERIPLPYGANGAIDDGGEWLAYTYYAEGRAEARGRHRGGNAPDVWLFNLRTRASRKMTEWEGIDTAPMWHGRTVHYLSDAGAERRLNLWSFDTAVGTRRQLTRYADFDVKWPSVGPGPRGEGEIVFSHGTRLALLDLATGEARDVEIRLPADAAAPAQQTFDAAKHVQRFVPAPDGSRAALEARGDVWVVGGPGVAPRNLTNSAAAAERDPAWSPDGRWIAYFSDASGEYELWVTPADGSPGARRLSEIGRGFRRRPAWSPDSRSIAFADSAGALYLASLESGRTIRFDVDPLVRQSRIAWSPDSAWIAYSRGAEGSTRSTAIWLYDVAAGAARQATSGWFSDDSPVFDRAGEYLYFVSARNLWDAVVFDAVDEGNFSELGASHTKVAPPSDEEPENTGVLGVDFELVDGAYRIAKIYDGPPTDQLARNPLRRPGVEVVEGEYLLAVDGKPLDPKVDPWAPFVGLASQRVTITVGPHPRIDPAAAAARQVVVTPRRSEPFVRNHAWVEANRVAVDRASGGRVGYVYLATTETYGSSEFTRQLAGQLDKEALVVDVRWNEGGFWPFHVVDVLARPRYLYVTEWRRAAGGAPLPGYILEGPSIMLINEISVSGGDALPYFFRKRGVGKLVGSRTLGGFVGVWPHSFLVDGGLLNVPHEGSYESSEAWAIEGHGVEPDIVVRETPTELAEGRDPQLEAAVRHLLKELEGRQRPSRPRPPGQ